MNYSEIVIRAAQSYRPDDMVPRVVLAHGCFDLLHLGHIKHLQQARSWGDRLIVSVTDDSHVNKGLGRPHFTAAQRVEALKALDCVDDAFINTDPDPSEAIRRIRPAVYAKGADYADPNHPGHKFDKSICDEIGTEFRITTTERWSSSRLINTEKFSDEICQFLESARERRFLPAILDAFKKADELSIAFVGEQIIDEYRYVRSLGKASKEYALATVEEGRSIFTGGVVAASKHAEWANKFVFTDGEPITKTRYVDADFNRKLFEVYSSPRIDLSPTRRDEFRKVLTRNNADVTIVFDFGHGLLEYMDRDYLCRLKFLAVNSQSNAGNYGFNPVTLYKRADFVCIDDPEARFAAKQQVGPLDVVVGHLSEAIDCKNFLITHGKYGSFYYGSRWGTAPAFIAHGIDTMGAGDAVMAVTAPLVASGLSLEAAALVGNVVGAIKVSILGHKRHVTRQEIIATLESLLK